jgi:hypothetical protein
MRSASKEGEGRAMQARQERGFALIAALLAIMILTALGVLVFTVSTQDVRISSRMVGEKKAFLSTEAGAHQLTAGFDPTNLTDSSKYNKDFQVDAGQDPGSRYRIAAPTIPGLNQGPAAVSIPGYGSQFGSTRFLSSVTGSNVNYGSTMQVGIGVGFGPVEITTIYR